MSSKLLYDFAGLQTAPGLLARAAASCVEADNVRFPAAGVIRKREGFAFAASLLAFKHVSLHSIPFLGVGVVAAVFDDATVQGVSVHNFATGNTQTPFIYKAEGCALETIGSMAAIGGAAYASGPKAGIIRVEEKAKGSGTAGVDKHAVRGAGMPLGREPMTCSMDAAVFSVLSAGTLLAANASRAYRVTWHRKMLDDQTELGGAPTGRVVIRNIAGTSGFAGVTSDVTLRIPLGLDRGEDTFATASYWWRLWGSRISTAAGDSPDDELYLIAEAYVTATDIARGYALYTDATPDVFLQAQPRLHTNSTNFPPLELSVLNGATNGDEPPPCALTLETFANCLWFGAPTFRPSFLARLISPLAAGDTLKVDFADGGALTLFAVAGAPAAFNEFTAVTGLPSLSLNLEAQARNICDAWNRYLVYYTAAPPANRVELFSVSQGTDSPGLIRFESHRMGFAVSSNAPTKWTPALTSSAAAPAYKGNLLCFSKAGRGDAVPPVNQLAVGPAGANIRATVAFRERMLVWTDAGLYAVDGSDASNFSVTLVDSTARILCARSAVVLRDRAYAWCYDGIVEISDGGTRRISEPIEPTLRHIREVFAGDGITFPGITAGFAIADRRNNEVQFFYSSKADGAVDSRCLNWLSWNAAAEKWATGSFSDAKQWQASGCCVFGSERVAIMGPKTNSILNGFNLINLQRLGHNGSGAPSSTDYTDAMRFLTGTTVTSTLAFQLQLNGLDSRAHWQQLRVDVEGMDSTIYPAPTALKAAWKTDAVGVSAAVTQTQTGQLLRWETPDLYRRATRQRVYLTHAAAEPCGIIGVAQTFADEGSRFAG